jgi:putative intracellular protease/amidase
MKNAIKSLWVGMAFFVATASHGQPLDQSLTKSKLKNMKVLFVLTSHDQLGNTGEKTGFWIEEFATPYYALTDQGIEVTIASPKGGQPPIDPKSNLPDYSTTSTKRFFSDAQTQKKLSQSVALKNVNPKDYDAVFYPGGHGPLWDLAEDNTSVKLIEDFYNSNKPVAFVCHAPGVLKNVKDRSGVPIVKGKKVTGFKNSEEAAVKLTNVVPFLVEDMLKANGGLYLHGDDWKPFVTQDGLLITGQNPASSELVAEKLIQYLSVLN